MTKNKIKKKIKKTKSFEEKCKLNKLLAKKYFEEINKGQK